MAGKNLLVNGKNSVTSRMLTDAQSRLANTTAATNVNNINTPNLPKTSTTSLNLQQAQQPVQTRLNNLNQATGIQSNNPAFNNGQLINQNNQPSRFIGFQQNPNFGSTTMSKLPTEQQGKNLGILRNGGYNYIPTAQKEAEVSNKAEEKRYKADENLIRKFHFAVKKHEGQMTADDIRKEFKEWKGNEQAALELQADIRPLVQQGLFANMDQISEYYGELLRGKELKSSEEVKKEVEAANKEFRNLRKTTDKALRTGMEGLSADGVKYARDADILFDAVAIAKDKVVGGATESEILSYLINNNEELKRISDEMNSLQLSDHDKAIFGMDDVNWLHKVYANAVQNIGGLSDFQATNDEIETAIRAKEKLDKDFGSNVLSNFGTKISSWGNTLDKVDYGMLRNIENFMLENLPSKNILQLEQGRKLTDEEYNQMVQQRIKRNQQEVLDYNESVNKDYQSKINKNLDPDIEAYYNNASMTSQLLQGKGKGFVYKGAGSMAENIEMPLVIGASAINPAVGFALMATDSYTREQQESFEELINSGANYNDALETSAIVGLASASVELLLEKAIGGVETTASDAIREAFMKEFNKNVTEMVANKGLMQILKDGAVTQFKSSLEEGLEEVVQQTIHNEAIQKYDKNQELTEGLLQAFEGGFFNPMNLLGGGADIYSNIKQNGDYIKENANKTAYNLGKKTRNVLDNAQEKINKGTFKAGEWTREVYDAAGNLKNKVTSLGGRDNTQGQQQAEGVNTSSQSNNNINGDNYNQKNKNNKTLNKIQQGTLKEYNKMNPTKIIEFKDKFGVDYGQAMADMGYTETRETNVPKMEEDFKEIYNEKKKAMNSVEGEFQDRSLSDMLEIMLQKAENTKDYKMLEKYQKLQKKHNTTGLTMAEANDMREEFSYKIKTKWNAENNSDKIDLANNVYTAVKDFLESTAEANGIKDLKKMNRDIAMRKYLATWIGDKAERQSANDNMSIADWVMMAEAVSNPYALAGLAGKKILQQTPVKNAVLNAVVGRRENRTIDQQNRQTAAKERMEGVERANAGKKLQQEMAKPETPALPNGVMLRNVVEINNTKPKNNVTKKRVTKKKSDSSNTDTTPPSNPPTGGTPVGPTGNGPVSNQGGTQGGTPISNGKNNVTNQNPAQKKQDTTKKQDSNQTVKNGFDETYGYSEEDVSSLVGKEETFSESELSADEKKTLSIVKDNGFNVVKKIYNNDAIMPIDRYKYVIRNDDTGKTFVIESSDGLDYNGYVSVEFNPLEGIMTRGKDMGSILSDLNNGVEIGKPVDNTSAKKKSSKPKNVVTEKAKITEKSTESAKKEMTDEEIMQSIQDEFGVKLDDNILSDPLLRPQNIKGFLDKTEGPLEVSEYGDGEVVSALDTKLYKQNPNNMSNSFIYGGTEADMKVFKKIIEAGNRPETENSKAYAKLFEPYAEESTVDTGKVDNAPITSVKQAEQIEKNIQEELQEVQDKLLDLSKNFGESPKLTDSQKKQLAAAKTQEEKNALMKKWQDDYIKEHPLPDEIAEQIGDLIERGSNLVERKKQAREYIDNANKRTESKSNVTRNSKNKVTVTVSKGEDFKPDNSGITGRLKNLSLDDYKAMQEFGGLEEYFMKGETNLIDGMRDLKDIMGEFYPEEYGLPEDLEIDYNKWGVKLDAEQIVELQELLWRIDNEKTTPEDENRYSEYYVTDKKGNHKWDSNAIRSEIDDLFDSVIEQSVGDDVNVDKDFASFYLTSFETSTENRLDEGYNSSDSPEMIKMTDKLQELINKYGAYWREGGELTYKEGENLRRQNFERNMSENETPQIPSIFEEEIRAEEELNSNETAQRVEEFEEDIMNRFRNTLLDNETPQISEEEAPTSKPKNIITKEKGNYKEMSPDAIKSTFKKGTEMTVKIGDNITSYQIEADEGDNVIVLMLHKRTPLRRIRVAKDTLVNNIVNKAESAVYDNTMKHDIIKSDLPISDLVEQEKINKQRQEDFEKLGLKSGDYIKYTNGDVYKITDVKDGKVYYEDAKTGSNERTYIENIPGDFNYGIANKGTESDFNEAREKVQAKATQAKEEEEARIQKEKERLEPIQSYLDTISNASQKTKAQNHLLSSHAWKDLNGKQLFGNRAKMLRSLIDEGYTLNTEETGKFYPNGSPKVEYQLVEPGDKPFRKYFSISKVDYDYVAHQLEQKGIKYDDEEISKEDEEKLEKELFNKKSEVQELLAGGLKEGTINGIEVKTNAYNGHGRLREYSTESDHAIIRGKDWQAASIDITRGENGDTVSISVKPDKTNLDDFNKVLNGVTEGYKLRTEKDDRGNTIVYLDRPSGVSSQLKDNDGWYHIAYATNKDIIPGDKAKWLEDLAKEENRKSENQQRIKGEEQQRKQEEQKAKEEQEKKYEPINGYLDERFPNGGLPRTNAKNALVEEVEWEDVNGDKKSGMTFEWLQDLSSREGARISEVDDYGGKSHYEYNNSGRENERLTKYQADYLQSLIDNKPKTEGEIINEYKEKIRREANANGFPSPKVEEVLVNAYRDLVNGPYKDRSGTPNLKELVGKLFSSDVVSATIWGVADAMVDYENRSYYKDFRDKIEEIKKAHDDVIVEREQAAEEDKLNKEREKERGQWPMEEGNVSNSMPIWRRDEVIIPGTVLKGEYNGKKDYYKVDRVENGKMYVIRYDENGTKMSDSPSAMEYDRVWDLLEQNGYKYDNTGTLDLKDKPQTTTEITGEKNAVTAKTTPTNKPKNLVTNPQQSVVSIPKQEIQVIDKDTYFHDIVKNLKAHPREMFIYKDGSYFYPIYVLPSGQVITPANTYWGEVSSEEAARNRLLKEAEEHSEENETKKSEKLKDIIGKTAEKYEATLKRIEAENPMYEIQTSGDYFKYGMGTNQMARAKKEADANAEVGTFKKDVIDGKEGYRVFVAGSKTDAIRAFYEPKTGITYRIYRGPQISDSRPYTTREVERIEKFLQNVERQLDKETKKEKVEKKDAITQEWLDNLEADKDGVIELPSNAKERYALKQGKETLIKEGKADGKYIYNYATPSNPQYGAIYIKDGKAYNSMDGLDGKAMKTKQDAVDWLNEKEKDVEHESTERYNETDYETLPKTISVEEESEKAGPKRIAPDRVKWQQETYEKGLENVKDVIKQKRVVVSDLGFKSLRGKAVKDMREEIQRIRQLPESEADKQYTELARSIYEDLVIKDISKGYRYPEDVTSKFPKTQMQKAIDARARYEKGLFTSFSAKDTRANNQYRDEIGAGIKSQDGKPVTQEQMNEIVDGIRAYSNIFGVNMKKFAEDNNVIYVHLHGGNPFLMGGMSIAGLYRRDAAGNISVSLGGREGVMEKGEDGKMKKSDIKTTTVHEITHAVDGMLEGKLFSDADVEILKKTMNKPSELINYYNRKQEIVARAVEQYAAHQLGKKLYRRALANIDWESGNVEFVDKEANYVDREAYWNQENFDKYVKPIVERNMEEKLKDYKIEQPKTNVLANDQNKVTTMAARASRPSIRMNVDKYINQNKNIVVNPDGKQVPTNNESKNGKKVVVDSKGKAYSFYHGTPNGGFEEFDMNSRGSANDLSSYGDFGKGFYFTTDKQEAINYATLNNKVEGKNPEVYEVKLYMNNPLDFRKYYDGKREIEAVYRKSVNRNGNYLGSLNEEEQAELDKVLNKYGFKDEEERDDFVDLIDSLGDNRGDWDMSAHGYDGVIGVNGHGEERVVFDKDQIEIIRHDKQNVLSNGKNKVTAANIYRPSITIKLDNNGNPVKKNKVTNQKPKQNAPVQFSPELVSSIDELAEERGIQGNTIKKIKLLNKAVDKGKGYHTEIENEIYELKKQIIIQYVRQKGITIEDKGKQNTTVELRQGRTKTRPHIVGKLYRDLKREGIIR